MSTSEVGAFLGYVNPGSTRKWLHKQRLSAVARDTETGEKIYRRSDVEEARQAQPGQGRRTDLW